MATLSRAEIEQAEDLGRELAEVPEWGGQVNVRMMNAGEKARLGLEYKNLVDEDVMFYVLSKTLVDDAGDQLFPGDAGVGSLKRKSFEVILRLYEVAARVNKLGKDAVEDAAKN